MSPFRYRDDESSTGTIVGVLVGALAGFAAGMFVAQRVGGFGGLTSRIRERAGGRFGLGRPEEAEDQDLDDYEEDEIESEEGYDESLEERVLEAFRNDPILSERAVDIGSIGDGIIELAGWVETEEEAEHAVTIARGVPDVDTVVNRITIGDEEERFRDAARRGAGREPGAAGARRGSRAVGKGRRRPGAPH